MASKRKNILSCIIIILLINFIYIPIRTGILEKQYVKYIIDSTEKIILSVSSFEENKKLRDKDLTKLYNFIKEKYPKYPIALIFIADKRNIILKAYKEDNYIKSIATFDDIKDSFLKDEFKITKKNNFIQRYYENKRYYIFVKNLTEGKILIVYPFTFKIKDKIELGLGILLISILCVLITAIVFIRKNKKIIKILDDNYKLEKSDVLAETDNTRIEKNKKKKDNRLEINKLNIEIMTDSVYDLFSYISKEYKSENASLYIKGKSDFSKVFELKGKTFLKIKDTEFNSLNLNDEIINELSNSSFLILGKGRKITLPILHNNVLLGIINITRDKEFKGPDIKDINSRIRALAKQFG